VRSVRSSIDGRSELGGGGYGGYGNGRGDGYGSSYGGGNGYGNGGGSVQGRERQLAAAPNIVPRRSYAPSSVASSAVGLGGVGTTWSEAELLRDVLYAFQVGCALLFASPLVVVGCVQITSVFVLQLQHPISFASLILRYILHSSFSSFLNQVFCNETSHLIFLNNRCDIYSHRASTALS